MKLQLQNNNLYHFPHLIAIMTMFFFKLEQSKIFDYWNINQRATQAFDEILKEPPTAYLALHENMV